MNKERQRHLDLGLAALPPVALPATPGRNGEELATDEAAVWKRVLNYRLAKFLSPATIFETHPGIGISTAIYVHSCPRSKLLDHTTYPHTNKFPELIDIDPFGQPWDTIAKYSDAIKASVAVMVSNGEAQAVVRNLKRAQRYPTDKFGRRMPYWVTTEYIPRLARSLGGMRCQFFYAFPTTVRTIHARTALPREVFEDCPQWMWWLVRNATQARSLSDHA